MALHKDDHSSSSVYRTIVDKFYQHLHTRQADGMAYGRNETHTLASVHRSPHSEHLQASKAGS